MLTIHGVARLFARRERADGVGPRGPSDLARAPGAFTRRDVLATALLLATLGCEDTGKQSVALALTHAQSLVDTAARDVAEVRQGLPLGADQLAKRWSEVGDLTRDPAAARDALTYAQNKVQDLRVAKSTFFALAGPDGVVVRNDREQDLMAGKALFPAFPALAAAAKGECVETHGALPEAHGVRGRADGEWVAACGVRVDGSVVGLYVTGWAWSSYAYRLQFALRKQIESALAGRRENVPLVYTFVVVGPNAYGAPDAPEVNARAIAERAPLSHLAADGTYSGLIELTGRTFALAVRAAPALGPEIGVAVLLSET